MDITMRARVLAIKSGRAVVECEGKKKTVSVRPDISVKQGDMVIIIFNTIVDKV